MNQLDVSLQHSIATLAAKGWSARKVARRDGEPVSAAGDFKTSHSARRVSIVLSTKPIHSAHRLA
jgi:hypothetical protein